MSNLTAAAAISEFPGLIREQAAKTWKPSLKLFHTGTYRNSLRLRLGYGAFRRYKNVLIAYMHERDRWFHFRNERRRQRALNRLDEEGINPIL
jgi:hypothetical protein